MGYGTEPQIKTGVTADTDPQATPAAVVRQDASAPLHSDGEWTTLQVDSLGRLKVNWSGGVAATEYAEDSPASPGDTGILPLVVRQDTLTSSVSSDGDYGTLKIDADGALWVKTSGSAAGTEYTEDAASAGGESGPLVMAVRQDTIAANTSLDGDYTYLKTDSTGALYVKNTTGAAGTEYTEDAASAGSESGPLILVVRRDTPSSGVSADGDYAVLSVNSTGALYVKHSDPVTIQDGGGSITVDGTVTADAGTGPWPVTDNGGSLTVDGTVAVSNPTAAPTEYTEDAASAGGESGPLVMAVRQDAIASSTSLDGDYTYLKTDSTGALYVKPTTGAAGTEYTEDAASAGGESGPVIMAVRQDTLASNTSADGDYTYLKTNANGSLYVKSEGGAAGTEYTEDAASAGGESGPLIMAVRQDTPATSTSLDGDYTYLKTDSTGHLYVKHSDTVAVTDNGGSLTIDGTVTADAGTGPWPVTDNGGSLTVDGTVAVSSVGGTVAVSDGAGSLTVDDGGTTISVDDGLGSLTVDGTVTADAGTGPWPVTDNGGSLTVDGTVAVSSVGGTVTVSDGAGSLTVDGTVTADAGTGPWPVTDNGGSLTVDGTVTANAGTGPWPVTDNGGSLTVDGSVSATQSGTWTTKHTHKPTPYKLNSAASTNATSVSGTGDTLLYGYYISNTNASVRYVKFYNKASAPTVGTDTPVLVLAIPGSGGANMSFPAGINFTTGLAFATTTGAADSDTGAVAANEIIVNLVYATY